MRPWCIQCRMVIMGVFFWTTFFFFFFLLTAKADTYDPGLQLPIVLVIQQSTEYSSYKVCFSSHATIVFFFFFLIIADMGKMFVFTSLKRIKNSIKAKNLMNFGKTPITIKS